MPSLVYRCFAVIGAIALVACAAPQEEETESGSESALTIESIGVTCKTLGEIGQCGAANTLCKSQSAGTCRAKAAAIESDPDWARICTGMANNKTACGWQDWACVWEETSSCIPKSGKPSAAAPNLPAACTALGELGSCGRVQACKAKVEGVCRATDDAIAMDPQWEQMCPRAGTTPDACAVQANCIWEDVTTCSPRSAAAQPLDVATACRTLADFGACGLLPSLCRSMDEERCVARPSALASDPEWDRICTGTGNKQACGWQSTWCEWKPVGECVPHSGPRPNAVVDVAKACDTFGQVGSCSRAPMCKVISQGSCRPTANALAGDPAWAGQCQQAGANQETCGWLAPNCQWEPATRCVPK